MVLNTVSEKPEMQHVVVTGRSALAELRELADTVSEIRDEKHAYKNGVKAQKGIDF